jgi:large subunit ribosomal protein L2
MKNKLHLNLKKTGGRNNIGKMTIYTIGGGTKRKYRLIDFKRSTLILYERFYAFILRIEKDPNRSSFIALICYPNGVLSYIIATEKMRIGSKIYNFSNSVSVLNLQFGNSFQLKFLSSGLLINNLELYPHMGSVLNRSAGVWAQIIKKYNQNYIQIKLKSGEHRLIHKDCRVVLGVVSNIYNNQDKLIKAGQSRLLGIRPNVRGRAMNPVDHPHGGRTNGGIAPKTPWGLLTKGKKTRKIIKTNYFIILKRKLNKN